MFSLALLIVFLAAMIGIGIWGMKKTATLNDFFLGGRTLGPWISAFAYGTTYFSAVIFIGFAGKQGWQFGLNALWIGIGNAVFGALLAWLVLGKRTRRMTKKLEVMTMPEFLESRYGSRHLKMISAAMIFIFLLPYSASVFKGLGHLFESTFGISYDFALIVLVGITGLYLILGGYFAVTMTDFIQGFIMLAGSIVMVAILFSKAGNPMEALAKIGSGYAEHIPQASRPSALTIGSLVFMTSFGTWGLPQMVQKFYAVKDERIIPKAALITTVFALVIGVSAYLTGTLSHVFFTLESVPRLASGAVNFDLIVPTLLAAHLPEALLALIMLLVLSASMSTLASMILVSSSAVTIDLYKGYVNPAVSEKKALVIIRALSGVFIICSWIISKMQIGFIVTLMSLSWGVLSGSFMAPYILGLFWKGVTKAGAYAGLAAGSLTAIALFFILGPANSPLASSIAMIVPFVVVPLVSLVSAKTDPSIIEKAFSV